VHFCENNHNTAAQSEFLASIKQAKICGEKQQFAAATSYNQKRVKVLNNVYSFGFYAIICNFVALKPLK